MRTLFTLTFSAIVAVAFAVYVLALIVAFITTSIGAFLVWLSSDGLPVTIGAAVVAAAVAAWLFLQRRREVGTDVSQRR